MRIFDRSVEVGTGNPVQIRVEADGTLILYQGKDIILIDDPFGFFASLDEAHEKLAEAGVSK